MTDRERIAKRTVEETQYKRRLSLSRRRMMQLSAAASLAAVAKAYQPNEVRADVKGKVSLYDFSGHRWEDVHRAILPLFEKKYPNIEVDIIGEPIGDAYMKISVIMSSQIDTFNTLIADFGKIPELHAIGGLSSFKSWLEQYPGWTENYKEEVPEAVWKLYNVPPTPAGDPFALCGDGNANLTFYRKDVFDKHGISVPKTWDEAIETCKEINDPKREVYAYCAAMQRNFWAGIEFWGMHASWGGEWFDKMESGYWNQPLTPRRATTRSRH